jgi:hypothetical protein
LSPFAAEETLTMLASRNAAAITTLGLCRPSDAQDLARVRQREIKK